MKKYSILIALMLLIGSSRWLSAQTNNEYLGLPGDNLNLYAVMDLFRESETLEGFERSLNNPDAIINNLDLNGDRLVDYIMVFDYPDDEIHNIVLRVALNDKDYQDVAVFTIEKFRNGSVMIQLIGDEALYGPDYIVEPNYDETPNPGYAGNVTKVKTRKNKVTVIHTTYYEVARWPVVVYVSRPGYVVWRSSWRWGYYPEYWSPWAPYYWHYYHGYHYGWNSHYHAYYRPWHHTRCNRYRSNYYTHIRYQSPTVVVNINKGFYKNSYSKPEKRKEGERVYAQRVSSGTTVPTRGFAYRTSGETKNASRNTSVSERGARTNVEQKRSATIEQSRRPERAARPANVEERAVRSSRATKPAQDENRRPNASVSTQRSERNRSSSGSTVQRSERVEKQRPAASSGRSVEKSTERKAKTIQRSSGSSERKSPTYNTSGSRDRQTSVKSSSKTRESRASSSTSKSSTVRSKEKRTDTPSRSSSSEKRTNNR